MERLGLSVNDIKGIKLCDVKCYNQQHTLEELAKEGAKITGIDRRIAGGSRNKVNYISGDIREINLTSWIKPQDIIVFYSFNDFDDATEDFTTNQKINFIKKCRNVLKDRGEIRIGIYDMYSKISDEETKLIENMGYEVENLGKSGIILTKL